MIRRECVSYSYIKNKKKLVIVFRKYYIKVLIQCGRLGQFRLASRLLYSG
jgi:hypothetical protein